MAECPQYEADRIGGENRNGTSEEQSLITAQLRGAANAIPAHVWYAAPSGVLVFVNLRIADYLGLPQDHPLRFGIDVGGEWDSHIAFLHPEDHEETRRVWSTCLRTSCPSEVTFRGRDAEGRYRWFLSRAEPVRAADGSVLFWVGVNFDIDAQKRAESALFANSDHVAHYVSAPGDLRSWPQCRLGATYGRAGTAIRFIGRPCRSFWK
jgi:PAS domain S-box-containing protein